jgi:stress response protein YsnF
MARRPHAGDLVIPVAQEDVGTSVMVSEVGRVRVSKHVEEHDVTVQLRHARDEVEVTRTKLDRPVDGPVPIRRDGDTIVVPVVEEIAVVQRRFVLREEIRITRKTTQRVAPEVVRLKRERAEIQRLSPRKRGEGRKG